MHDVFYSPATPRVARYVSTRLREADENEMMAYGFWTRDEIFDVVERWAALPNSFSGFIDGDPVCLFGIHDSAPWMVGTEAISDAPLSFHRAAKLIMNCWKSHHDYLSNYVLAENKSTVKWLRRIGFDVSDEIMYPGVEGREFLMFEWRA